MSFSVVVASLVFSQPLVAYAEEYYTISGTFTDRAGNPIANIPLKAVTTVGDVDPAAVLFSTNASGHYSINVTPGTYAIRSDGEFTEIYGDLGHLGQIFIGTSNVLPYIDATNGNVTQDLQLDTVPLNVNFVDQNGDPISNAVVSLESGDGATTIPVGRPDVIYPTQHIHPLRSTNASGIATATVLRGLTYTACAVDPITHASYCVNFIPKIEGINNVVIAEYVKPVAPTGLSAQSPTVQAPLLTWSAVNDADHYDVWRDGHKVDSSVSTNFTDSGAGGGSHVYYVIAVSRFNLSSDPSNVIIVVYDSTPPILGASTWAANPLQQGQTTTLSIPVSDGESDVASVQYAVNGSTPQAMAHDFGSNTWQATFGSSLTASMYNITIIATDLAGNTTITTEILAVYNPSNGYVAGHVKTLPTTSDKLPIALDTSNNPAKLVVGFTNVMAPTSGSFDVGYVVKKNKNEFSINSTAISWVVVQDSTHASILGHADLTTYVNGVQTVTQNVSVRFEIVLGTSGAPDHVTVKIYNPGADPNIGLPAYTISDDVIANGSHLMIHP